MPLRSYSILLLRLSRLLSVMLFLVPLVDLYLLVTVGINVVASSVEIYVRNVSSILALFAAGAFFNIYYLSHKRSLSLFMKSFRYAAIALAVAGIVKVLISLYYLWICIMNGNIIVWFYAGEILVWTGIALFAFLYYKKLSSKIAN